MILNKSLITEYLKSSLQSGQLSEIKNRIEIIKENIQNSKRDKLGFVNIVENGDTITIRTDYLNSELNQILETRTIERTKYYIERLIKALSQEKTNRINDFNLNRWKEYSDIITDSLWILGKRDNSGAHNAGYWGNFIPQIPNQLLQRYTKKGDGVLDTFLGCGTTLIECKRLGRNGIGIELQNSVAKIAKDLIDSERNLFEEPINAQVVVGDSARINYENLLQDNKTKGVQFLIMHPPYWDIIKFSQDKRDLSNAISINAFLKKLGTIIDKTWEILDSGRYFALVIGDKYHKGDWIPLGFYCMQEVLKRKYKLKSIIIKNFEQTKGKMNQQELWRFRALAGGFYIFKHEYIFLFKKA